MSLGRIFTTKSRRVASKNDGHRIASDSGRLAIYAVGDAELLPWILRNPNLKLGHKTKHGFLPP